MMSRSYADFIAAKRRRVASDGITLESVHGPLFDFQEHTVRWSLDRARSCIFADCGLGKTIMQLEWANHVCRYGRVLILTPLAVARQTELEAQRFGYDCAYAADHDSISSSIAVTNYEKLHRFEPSEFAGVVLDESSILKNYTGKTRNAILDAFSGHRFKLACSATPAPNDFMELGNHSEFVGAMTRSEMLSMYFIHDGGSVQNWRLKGHASGEFWRWVGEWAVMFRTPDDLGFDGTRFELPELTYHETRVESGHLRDGMLFNVGSASLHERRAARRASLEARCKSAADLANSTMRVGADANLDQWVLWCDLNDESSLLSRLVPDAVEIRGSDTDAHKSLSMLDFAAGKIRVLVTKPSIAGHGMNWQNCHRMAFVGLSDSYEALYQATRRCWRFGQTNPVRAHIITSDSESDVLKNVMRKERDHKTMQARMSELLRDSA